MAPTMIARSASMVKSVPELCACSGAATLLPRSTTRTLSHGSGALPSTAFDAASLLAALVVLVVLAVGETVVHIASPAVGVGATTVLVTSVACGTHGGNGVCWRAGADLCNGAIACVLALVCAVWPCNDTGVIGGGVLGDGEAHTTCSAPASSVMVAAPMFSKDAFPSPASSLSLELDELSLSLSSSAHTKSESESFAVAVTAFAGRGGSVDLREAQAVRSTLRVASLASTRSRTRACA